MSFFFQLDAAFFTVAFEPLRLFLSRKPCIEPSSMFTRLVWATRHRKRRFETSPKREMKGGSPDRRLLLKKTGAVAFVTRCRLSRQSSSTSTSTKKKKKKHELLLRRLHPRALLGSPLRPRPHARGGLLRGPARAQLRPARRRAARQEEGRPGEFEFFLCVFFSSLLFSLLFFLSFFQTHLSLSSHSFLSPSLSLNFRQTSTRESSRTSSPRRTTSAQGAGRSRLCRPTSSTAASRSRAPWTARWSSTR